MESKSPKSGDGYFPCSLCSKVFNNQTELDHHIKTDHLCIICDKTFSKKANLKRHKAQAHGESSSPFKCTVCNQVFSSKSNLKRHIAVAHGKAPKFKCDICNETFSAKSSLTRHMKLAHGKASKFKCDICNETFSTKSNLIRHMKLTHGKAQKFKCNICNETFSAKSSLIRHMKLAHGKAPKFKCSICKAQFSRKSDLKRHILDVHKKVKFTCKLCSPNKQFNSRRLFELHNRTKHQIRRGRFICPKCKESFSFLGNFKRHLEEKHNFKPSDFVCFRCHKKFKTERDLIAHIGIKHRAIPQKVRCQFCSKTFATTSSLSKHLKEIHSFNRGYYFCRICDEKFLTKNEFEKHQCFGDNLIDSKFVLKSPSDLSKEESFQFAICAKDDVDPSTFDWGDNVLDFPTFEERNNVSISIFSIKEGKLLSLYVTSADAIEEDKHFDLIKINNQYHLILDFDGLLRNKIFNHHRVKMCRRCRAYFYKTFKYTAEEQLKRHSQFCQGKAGGAPLFHDVPKGDKSKLRFRAYEHLKKKRFIIYLDFESLTTPIDEPSTSSSTITLQRHVPFSFGYLLKDGENDHLTKYRSYCGLDAPSKLFEWLEEDINKIEDVLYSNRIPEVPKLTPQQQLEFDEATVCHICSHGGFDDRNKKVRSHDHVSGLYLGAAHSRCNLFYRDQRTVNVVVHNLSKYDANFIIPELGKKEGKISVIPHSTDKFISFSKKMGKMTLQFIDSFRFLASSLDKLSELLTNDKKRMCRKFFPDVEQFNLITSKGVLPYDYLSSLSKLSETSLPPIEAFYSILTDQDIKTELYAHAKNVWQTFKCKTLKDYVMIYQKCDVVLLCDVFEDFREMSMRDFQLDPSYYVSAPGLTFDAMLKYTSVTIDLLTDLEMVKFIQRALRGGLVGCSHRWARANNPYMEHLYDPSKPTSYLWYTDANNLYGYSLSQHLPLNNFMWVEGSDELAREILKLPPDGDIGYFVEVDMDYPDHLHDDHNDMPFLPEVQVVDGQKMLMESLSPRSNYVCHYRTLQQAVDHGLVLTKFHRGIRFNQARYIAPYVELTTQKRMDSRNKFEEEFWKLMNNSLYGKTCERVEKRIQVKIPNTLEQVDKLTWSPQFIETYIYGENLVMFHMAPKTVVFNKPIFIGAAVLDLSKVHLYSFFYDILKPKYGDRIRINYKDTDAILTSIYTEDMYHDFLNDQKILQQLDTRNYHPNHPLFSLSNRLIPGKFKDEVAPDILTEYVGLRSKKYATKRYDVRAKIEKTDKKKSKGTQKRLIEREVTFEDYKNSVFNVVDDEGQVGRKLDNVRIASRKGKVTLVKQKKRCLNPHDKKRFILPNRINTLAFGHYAIRNPDP